MWSEVSSEAASEAKLGVQDVHQSERGDPHRDRKGGGKARGSTKLTLQSTGAEMARKPGGVSCLGLYLSTASCHCPWAIPGTGVSWGQAALRQQGDRWSS